MMRRLLFGVLLLMFVQGVSGQEQFPPLVGPVVYGQPINGPIVFQDLGSGEVWEINGDSVIEYGSVLSWSPNGCYALYGDRGRQQYALIDVQQHSIEKVDFPLILDEEILSIAGEPRWSPDGRRVAYGLFDGANTTFNSYNFVTGETEILYIREDYESGSGAFITGWPSENALTYGRADQNFEVNLTTGEIEYLLRAEIVNVPVYTPFSRALRSPNNEAIAMFFDLSEAWGIRDVRFSYNNQEEIEAMDRVIVERSGIDIYVVATGETIAFDLGGQVVSAAAWSPDGARLAILTWPSDDYETANGAYIYDVATNTMSPVDDLHPVRHTDPGEYGFFQPGWSANGEWVTLFALEQQWVAYNVEEETLTPLAEPFQESISMMQVLFTSVTNYEPGACNILRDA